MGVTFLYELSVYKNGTEEFLCHLWQCYITESPL
jgi:hypothetical protein